MVRFNVLKVIKGWNYPNKSEVKSEGEVEYFSAITIVERKKVQKWLRKELDSKRRKTASEREFLDVIEDALQEIDYDYWIANLEPSVSNGHIYYAKGEKVGGEITVEAWEMMAKEYAPERGSRIAKMYELYLWYALRIAEGLWTLKFVAEDSSGGGNYYTNHNYSFSRDRAGEKKCGGYYDGQGNTQKIVSLGNGEYGFVGGNWKTYGYDFRVGLCIKWDIPNAIVTADAVGCLVLTK